ncbi:hypothetical protein AAG570_005569 [Ranatra chinensis]|uniref:BRCT domain-containing protein n=1 Tax=Ranatra chinensis TaxID=642074 RepID=A0ABD0YG68_9HEMI
MASKRRNMFQKNKTQETTENGIFYLFVISPQVTPSNSQSINSQRINDYDDDELEFELGIRSKRHASGGSVSGKDESAFMTPPVQRRISVASPGPSPFHIDTPDSPYGQVFADDPSPETRKKWKRYIDGFPDLYEGSPALKDRRLSTPLSVIKKQLLVKFGGAELEGIDPETGDLLPNGPYGQWANGACDVSGAASLPPEAPIAEGRGDVGVEKKPISLEKINPRVLALKSNENTPLSSTKNAKKFVRKGTFESPKPEETPEQKQATAQYKRTPELDLMEKYRNFDANNEITDEMRKRLANRLKPTSQDSDDADNPLKETLKRDMEGSVTWDIERPKYLEKMMEKELAKKAAKLVDGKSWAEDATETTLEGPAEPKGPPMKFTLSSMQQTNREKYENIIKNLGGEVSSTSHYDSSITHIVIDKPIRSEKLLCSIASGKWVLHVSYLDQCYESRQFLPEEDYEWGNPRSSARLPAVGVGSQEALLARAAYWWRHRVTEIGARLALPFAAMKAVLLTVPNKTPQYSRLLLAGGATILEQEKILEATHCFVDVGKVKIPVDIKQLARREIHCLPPVYLGDYLSKIPAPSPQNYWIEEYRNAFEALKNSK